jgi:hypothetical protein
MKKDTPDLILDAYNVANGRGPSMSTMCWGFWNLILLLGKRSS